MNKVPRRTKAPVVSPSELLCKKILDTYFRPFRKIDNIRPSWLDNLELDRYYPDLGVGIEFQGIQHYRPTKALQKTRRDFFERLQFDTKKIQLAQKQGIKIFPISLKDISQDSYKRTIKQIADYAASYTQSRGKKEIFRALMSIDWRKEPDESIFKRLASIQRSKKWQVEGKKYGFLRGFFNRWFSR